MGSVFLGSVLLVAGLAACSEDSDPSEGSAPVDGDTDLLDGADRDLDDLGRDDGVIDLPADLPGEDSTDGATDVASDADAPDDAGSPLELAVGPPLGPPPVDPLRDSDVVACPVYLDEVCQAGRQLRCVVYDVDAAVFPEAADPLLDRVLRFERWYDLYHSPDGQTADRTFRTATAAGTPEAEWGALEHFDRYTGIGDAAIWTGVALNARILRYLVTGTEADYRRMEEKVDQLLLLFDVTGIDGYLARHHFLRLEPGGPVTDRHIVLYDASFDHRYTEIDQPSELARLPEAYLEGIPDESGTLVRGTPMWHGNPSIDQYTGPMVALPAAYGLLRDEVRRRDIATHLTCYLNRLRRIEVINLQESPVAQDLIEAFLAGGRLDLEPGDYDFREVDRIVAYVLEQPNSTNVSSFDRSCPEHPALAPTRVVDAGSSTFLAEMGALALDLQSRDNERPHGIDHVYLPNLRGGDAIHLMHLAAMAYYFTGDAVYRDFLQDELLGELRTAEVAHTAGALIPPRWCRAFYGNHITFAPAWAFINLLEASPLRTEMLRVLHTELWEKLNYNLGNAKFNLMYAGVSPPEIGLARDEALSQALDALQALGGNGGIMNDPRRTYSLAYETVLAGLPEGNEPICPTEDERAWCEEGIDTPLPLPRDSITSPCLGQPGECPIGDGCARAMASGPLPVELRHWEDFLWQRNPFAMGAAFPIEGWRQSPGLDLIESYWLARHYGFIDGGRGQVLAWRDVGPCP